MLTQIKGLHHVTSMAADAQENNDFFTKTLALRRVRKTVNFDAPDVYHLYYGDCVGSPCSLMTYFPFPQMEKGRRGAGEVTETVFSVPRGSISFWKQRLADAGVSGLKDQESFGEKRLRFCGRDGDGFSLVEADEDRRQSFSEGLIDADDGVRGFRGVTMRVRDGAATNELLRFMNYDAVERTGSVTRYAVKNGNGADFIDLEVLPGASPALQGAGSVHHVAFAVENRAAQLEVRKALMDTGYCVTPVIDRDYFWAIYFRSPGGILFEVATNEPGFDHDEDTAHLGEALKIPRRHAHLRAKIEQRLPPLRD